MLLFSGEDSSEWLLPVECLAGAAESKEATATRKEGCGPETGTLSPL